MAHHFAPTATDLQAWADRLEARSTLPGVIRRLAYETTPDLSQLDFRTDEGVQLRGWDGRTAAAEGNAWVPAGLAGWEMGTNQRPSAKADHDFESRTAEVDAQERAATTFVFVTPRRWSGHEGWVAERVKEAQWKAVRVLDADCLAGWLEQAPATATWLASLMGKQPTGAQPLDAFWQSWSLATQPAVSADLCLARRTNVVDALIAWLAGPPDALELNAESVDEAVAFMACALGSAAEPTCKEWGERAIVVDNERAWAELVTSPRPLLLVARFDGANAGQAVAKGHHVLVASGRDKAPSRQAVVLPPLDHRLAHDALQAMDFGFYPAQDLLQQTRYRLHGIRWRLLAAPSTGVPEWVNGPDAGLLAALMLVGEWDQSREADQRVVAAVTGRSAEEAEQGLARLASQANAPVFRAGDVWRWSCRREAWPLLSRHFTKALLARFEATISEVLGAADPALGLPLAERWAANIYGKGWSWSEQLRASLAESLVHLALYSDACPVVDGKSGADRADLAVRQLLANASAETWYSIAGLLPALAEAAPEEVLGAVRRALKADPSQFMPLFAEAPPMDYGRFSGLLFALETLAWEPDYLTTVAEDLAQLAAMDPGGSVASRPAGALARVLLPLHPGTAASLDARKAALEAVIRRVPEVGWSTALSLLPQPFGMAMPIARPEWRDWAPDGDLRATYGDYYGAVHHALSCLLRLAGEDGARWAALVGVARQLGDEQPAILDALEAQPIESWDDVARRDLVAALRAELHTCHAHPGFADQWVGTGLDQLRALYERSQPNGLVLRHAWLFDQWPQRPEGESDHQAEAQQVDGLRQQAVAAIHSAGGLTAIAELAHAAVAPYAVGRALAHTTLQRPDELVLVEWLAGADGAQRLVASGYIESRFTEAGWDWVASVVEGSAGSHLPEQAIGLVGCALPFERPTWEWVASQGTGVNGSYWQEVAPVPYRIPCADIEYAVERLMSAGRPVAALRCVIALAMDSSATLVPELAALVLESVAAADDVEVTTFFSDPNVPHKVAAVFQALDRSAGLTAEKLAALELLYAPLLFDSLRPPITLYAAMADDPGTFVEILKWQYRDSSAEDDGAEPSDTDRHRASLAFRLLHEWRGLPGRGEDGTVDGGKLLQWARQVLLLAEAAGRLTPAQHHIGYVLSRAPSGPDSVWPCAEVRDVIEDLDNEEVEQGVAIGVHNGRGVVTRSIGEGGEQERVLARQHRAWADAVAAQWPRTASVLRDIADGYERDAGRADAHADLE